MTIVCLDSHEFCLKLVNVATVKIHDIHIQNCSCFKGYGLHHYILEHSIIRVEIVNSRFTNSCLMFQYPYDKVTVIPSTNVTITIENTTFEKCSDKCGSILDLLSGDLPFILRQLNLTLHNLNVKDNSAPFLYLMMRHSNFTSAISFTGHSCFIRSKGFISNLENSTIHFKRADIYFVNNTVNGLLGHGHGAPIHVAACVMTFEHSHIIFQNNQGSLCGGISAAHYSKIIFTDNATVQFINNNGVYGGALSLDSGSILVLNAIKSNISLNFKDNTAQRGGAIYVEDSRYNDIRSVFDLQCNATQVKLIFHNNSAIFDVGNQIYGGWVDWFLDENGVISNRFDTIENILYFKNSSNSEIASDPIRICLCKDDQPNCIITNHTMEVYGYAVSLDLVAVGQRYIPVSAYVEASVKSGGSESEGKQWLHVWPTIESLNASCTRVSYKIYSTEETLVLEPYSNCDHHNIQNPPKNSDNSSLTIEALPLFQQLSIQLKFEQCPLGFMVHSTDRRCVCQSSLSSHDLSCDEDHRRVHRRRQQWVGVTHEHTIVDQSSGVIVHQYCPFDYCRTDDESLSIHLEDQDEQCAFNRTGVLCGSCKSNYSRVLGSSTYNLLYSRHFQLISEQVHCLAQSRSRD